jgi:hypothetical protein
MSSEEIKSEEELFKIPAIFFNEMNKLGIRQIAVAFNGGSDDGRLEPTWYVFHDQKVDLSKFSSNEYTFTQEHEYDTSIDSIDRITSNVVLSEERNFVEEFNNFVHDTCIGLSFDGEVYIEGMIVFDAVDAKIARACNYEVKVKEEQLIHTINFPSLSSGVIDESIGNDL